MPTPPERVPFTWDEARKLAWELGAESARSFGNSSHSVPLNEALGRYAAADISTPFPLPHYASSAMDGWALGPQLSDTNTWQIIEPGSAGRVRPGETEHLRPGETEHLRPGETEHLRPGEAEHLRPGEATPVVTGQAIPEGTAVVLPLEIARQPTPGELSVALSAPAHALTPGRHIRRAGTEASAGEVLVARGTRLTPVYLALIAATGADSVTVSERVEVGLVRSGNEVIESGVPGPGQVRDSFSLLLPPALTAWNGRLVNATGIRDSLEVTLRALGESAQLLVTTGGTGPGSADHVLDALQELGARVVFAAVAMRPGHPTLLAMLPDGRMVLGLPGNPLAAMTAAVSFVPALMAGMRGDALPELPELRVAEEIEPLPGRTRVAPAVLGIDGLRRAEWTGSGMLRGLAEAQLLMVVPENGAASGAPVRVLPLPWPVGPQHSQA